MDLVLSLSLFDIDIIVVGRYGLVLIFKLITFTLTLLS